MRVSRLQNQSEPPLLSSTTIPSSPSFPARRSSPPPPPARMVTAVPLGLIRRPPMKRRRTATSVLAGDFDARPPRDVLTSLLNGVGPYERVEGTEEQRRARKIERMRHERGKEKRRSRKQNVRKAAESTPRASVVGVAAASKMTQRGTSTPAIAAPLVNSSTSSFWRTRGPVELATRSVSPSPPPELSPPPTPGPSISSTMSYGSSKRPHTPDDGVSLTAHTIRSPTPVAIPRERRKRPATRKGWKGWVEGSPPPSDKLINLDEAPVMTERRTRSGKNFDAISEGKDGWINPGANGPRP